MKIPFDIKYRPQIESGEYHVETKAGCPVRIVCWDMACELPILGLVLLNDEKPEEIAVSFTNKGTNLLGEPLYDKLFIITPDHELTEFEKAVGLEIFDEPFDETHIKVIKEESAKLLDLARKEIEEELKEKVFNDYWKLVSNQHIQAIKETKEETLKDLPRWRKWGNGGACSNGRGIPIAIVKRGLNDYELVNTLGNPGEQCIMLSELKKLPGFKEE